MPTGRIFVTGSGWTGWSPGTGGLPSTAKFGANIKQWTGTSSQTTSTGQYWSSSHTGCGSSGTYGE